MVSPISPAVFVNIYNNKLGKLLGLTCNKDSRTHWKEAGKITFGLKKLMHLALAALEFIPIVSGLASLGEHAFKRITNPQGAEADANTVGADVLPTGTPTAPSEGERGGGEQGK